MKACSHCGHKDLLDTSRFCPICGKQQDGAPGSQDSTVDDEGLEATQEFQAMPGDERENLRDRKTEVLSQSVIQEKLDQIRESIAETDESKPRKREKSPKSSGNKRRFSETMWFMQGLDSDQLVEDSDEDVTSDDLQERYQKKKTLDKGIRKQFTLSDEEQAARSKDRSDSESADS